MWLKTNKNSQKLASIDLEKLVDILLLSTTVSFLVHFVLNNLTYFFHPSTKRSISHKLCSSNWNFVCLFNKENGQGNQSRIHVTISMAHQMSMHLVFIYTS